MIFALIMILIYIMFRFQWKFAVGSVAAQSGGLTIKVVDAADQSPLPGALVILTNTVQLISETAVLTDPDGLAEFPILRAGGGYIVQVTLEGQPLRYLNELELIDREQGICESAQLCF